MPSQRAATMPFYIRWVIRRDMPEVLAIEEAVKEWDAWPEEEFLRRLRERNCIGMIAEKPNYGPLYGFMVYSLEQDHIRLDNICVLPEYRGHGIGYGMIRKLAEKLSGHRRTFLRVDAPEDAIALQVWLRKLGFLAVEQVADAIRMELHMETP